MTMSPPSARDPLGVHLSALRLLCELGWSFLSTTECLSLRGSTREPILKPRLVQFLQSRFFEYKGKRYPLSPLAVDHIARELMALSLGNGLMAANERFYRMLSLGIPVTEFMPDGKKHQPVIALIDWTRPEANRWEVTEHPAILSSQGTHHRTPDIVCYVNGLPLAVIEAKPPECRSDGRSMMDEGIRQHLHNQRPEEIPGLFVYAQLLLAISQRDGRYGTTQTPAKFWARWREHEFDEAHFVRLKRQGLSLETRTVLLADKTAHRQADLEALTAEPQPPTDLDRLFVGLLTPLRLLEILRGFIVFDRKAGKLIARYPQFFGTRAVLARIRGLCPPDGPDDGRRQGGVVWHSCGSGKRLTMVFLCRSLLLDPALDECRVIVVTDRVDLETQLGRNFASGGEFGAASPPQTDSEKNRAIPVRDLAQRIAQGRERILFTLVQKFNSASQLPECRNDSPNIVVLVDEGHHTHGRETHSRMKKALPRAACVVFTGTPLPKDDKAAERLGPIVHAYTRQQAVDDEVVVPLLYEERNPGLDIDEMALHRWLDKISAGLDEHRKADLRSLCASKDSRCAVANRIELIAWDIALHFNESIRKRGRALKGLVATDSKLDAIRFKRALDQTGLVTSAVIISPPELREGNSGVDEASLPEVRQWWDMHAGSHADTPEANVPSGFSDEGDPDLLIVVDRLLTDLDDPRNAVLYIDKSLQAHHLILAVARVNRLHEAKRYGVLVDYRGILTAFDTTMRAYRDLEGLYLPLSTEYRRLPALHEALWALFSGISDRLDLEQYRQILMPRFVMDSLDEHGETCDSQRELRENFYAALNRFGLCLQTAFSSHIFFEDGDFPEVRVSTYKEDLRFFVGLRRIARQDALEAADDNVCEDQIRRLVDTQVIGKEVREPEGIYRAQPEDPESWSDTKTRNETALIRNRLRHAIEVTLADDPYSQSVFGQQLKALVAKAEALADHPLQQYALFHSFEDHVAQHDIAGIPAELADQPRGRAYFGILRLALAGDMDETQTKSYVDQAMAIDAIVQLAVAENSLNPQNIDSAIRKALLPQLFAQMGLEKARALIDQVIRITRISLARRENSER